MVALLSPATMVCGCTCGDDAAAPAVATVAADAPPPAAIDAAPRKGPWFAVVNGLTDVTHIAAGYSHVCAIAGAGKVYCWGRNDAGQLGNGSTVNVTTPVAVKLPFAATMIDAGYDRTCAAAADGRVACWGKAAGKKNAPSLVPVVVGKVRGLRAISSGLGFSCVAAPKSGVQCFGAGDHRELGKENRKASTKPVKIAGTVGATDVAASWHHACAVVGTKVICWGESPAARLTNRDEWTADTQKPRPVAGLPPAREVFSTRDKTCAITVDGHVWCWGHGVLHKHAPAAMRQPVIHPSLSKVVGLAIGPVNACALGTDGVMTCWGAFGAGGIISTPRPIEGMGEVLEIDEGYQHTCAVRKDHTVACFGNNKWGQLGNGTWGSYLAPY
ncbi:MAG TPA: hypothetical protein VFG83_16925 [Kofleriaceae bacterium]|nr:hypothetical protein [Kofleriaceae bacterium]